eukprot:9084229-Alexandrium_andersonii.AAC.1
MQLLFRTPNCKNPCKVLQYLRRLGLSMAFPPFSQAHWKSFWVSLQVRTWSAGKVPSNTWQMAVGVTLGDWEALMASTVMEAMASWVLGSKHLQDWQGSPIVIEVVQRAATKTTIVIDGNTDAYMLLCEDICGYVKNIRLVAKSLLKIRLGSPPPDAPSKYKEYKLINRAVPPRLKQ